MYFCSVLFCVLFKYINNINIICIKLLKGSLIYDKWIVFLIFYFDIINFKFVRVVFIFFLLFDFFLDCCKKMIINIIIIDNVYIFLLS